jgi:son of sevenless-like protein
MLSIDKEAEKHKVQGQIIEPGGQVIDISRPPSDGTPWYLRPQYADQLDTDDKGNVRFGSLLSLFEMLTFPPKPTSEFGEAQAHYGSDTDELADLAQYKTFTNVFLMTFRTFTTADHLFDMLVERFHLKPYESLTETEFLNWKANLRTPVQRLVLEILKRWLENYQLSEEEPHIEQPLKEFLDLIVSPPHNKIAANIIQTIDRMVRWGSGFSVSSD